jgi:hypothetical protein
VCGKEFARRRCSGNQCDGMLYCAPCFTEYHPPKDDNWASHWQVDVQGGHERLHVKAYAGDPGALTQEAIEQWRASVVSDFVIPSLSD